jgi:hypothetical protein
MSKKKKKNKTRRAITSASTMDVPVGERAHKLRNLGQRLEEIDAARIAFKKSGIIQVPTANDAAMCMVVSMTVSHEDGQALVLEMMDTCQEQIESQMAALLDKKAA